MAKRGYSFNIHAWLPLFAVIWIGIVKNQNAPSIHWRVDHRLVITRLYSMWILAHSINMNNHSLLALVCGCDDGYYIKQDSRSHITMSGGWVSCLVSVFWTHGSTERVFLTDGWEFLLTEWPLTCRPPCPSALAPPPPPPQQIRRPRVHPSLLCLDATAMNRK